MSGGPSSFRGIRRRPPVPVSWPTLLAQLIQGRGHSMALSEALRSRCQELHSDPGPRILHVNCTTLIETPESPSGHIGGLGHCAGGRTWAAAGRCPKLPLGWRLCQTEASRSPPLAMATFVWPFSFCLAHAPVIARGQCSDCAVRQQIERAAAGPMPRYHLCAVVR